MNVDNYRVQTEIDASRARWRMFWVKLFSIFKR